MKKSFKTFLTLCLMLLGAVTANAFDDIKLDLTNANYLTDEEEKSGGAISFGVAIAADGTATRVDAGDASANIVLSSARYNDGQHGHVNLVATVPVEGAVRITVGTCQYGGQDVVVKNSANEEVAKFNSNNGTCYHGNKADNVASGYYKGTEATTLTISINGYTPYIAVEAVDPTTLVEDATVTFSLDGAEGIAPTAIKAECGSEINVPVNKTVYSEGKTLVAWTDGTNEFSVGGTMTVPTADVTLTPVFKDNAVSLSDPRDGEVTVVWDFQQKNGAPVVGIQGNTAVWVAQATIGSETIDVKMDVDATSGKLANGNWPDWAQINGGTKLTIPAAKTVKLTLESYSATKTTTIDGETIDQGTTTPTYDYAGDAETIDIVIGDGSYWRYVKAVYPAIKEESAGKTYTNEAASVVWPFNSTSEYESNVKTPADGFVAAEVNLGDLTVTGTATRTADDLASGVTFIKLKPAGSSKAAEWSVKPAMGLTFTPTKVSMWIQRFGTDAEKGVVVTAKLADGTSETLGTYTAARANKDKAYDADNKGYDTSYWTNQVVIELTAEQQAKFASADGFTISATVGVGSTKEGGFSDVYIEGLLNGTIADVAKYTLTTNVTPSDAAGTVTAKPKAAEYEDGTEITLTAAKNFGYKFVNWTDGEGNVLGENATYTFVIEENTVVNANFEAVNTYELTYGVDAESGAKLYMVTPTPAPVVVDGKNMYEEGTTVTLKAESNPILKFTNWNNGETAGEISFVMNADREFIANYTAEDYIAGWDFILPGNNGRVADFAAADNDADALILRDAEGTTYGWLDKSWQGQGGYEGRPAGVNWTTIELGKTYWQTKINAAAYKNIKLQTAMVYNYNAYKTYNVEYSLDGETWTLAGQIEMPGTKAWTDLTVTLPEECDNKAEVYVRWIADKTSVIDGTSSNNDGATIGATYFTGVAELVNDGVAPVLVSSVPAEGADNASANGKIVLTFDEKVKLTSTAKATIGDMAVNGVATGKTVTFEYKSLNYSTNYTFTLAAGSVADLTDNAIEETITINFSTKLKPAVEKKLYDFVVGTDGTIDDALAAANKRGSNATERYRIFLPNGKYVFQTKGETTGGDGNTYGDPRSYLTAPYVSFIGESMEGVEITNITPAATWDNGFGTACPLEGIGNGDVLIINKEGHDAYFQNLTIKTSMGDAHGRDIALQDKSNRTIFKDACLWGYQDTYVSNNQNGKFYFEGGVLRGRTDYLCGKGDVVYNEVTLQQCGGGGYTAVPSQAKQFGYVFWNCYIKAETSDVTYYLGRPWGSGTPIACFINTKMDKAPLGNGWADMSGGYPKRFAEYNSTLTSGTTIDLSGRRTSWTDKEGVAHANNPILTIDDVNSMTIANVMGQDDDWDPTAATEQASAPTNVYVNTTTSLMTWDNSDYALLWAVCKDGKVVDFTIEPTYTVDDASAEWSVRAANEMGGLGEATVAVKAESVNTLLEATSYYVTGTVKNISGKDLTDTYFAKYVENGEYKGACILDGDATLLTVGKNSEGILEGFSIASDAIAYTPAMYFTVDGRDFTVTNLAGDASGSLQLSATAAGVALEDVAIYYKGTKVGTISNILFTKDATGVNSAEAAKAAADGKYLKNGKVVILKNGKTYTAVGAAMK